MKRTITAICLLALAASAQSSEFWQDAKLKPVNSKLKVLNANASDFRAVRIHESALTELLKQKTFELKLPLPDGEEISLRFSRNSLMPEALQQRFNRIRAFNVSSGEYPQTTGRFEITPKGLTGVLQHQGQTIYFDPKWRDDAVDHIVYYRQHSIGANALLQDRIKANPEAEFIPLNLRKNKKSVATTIRQYRLAVSAVGEYTQYHGGTKEDALAAIVTMVNRLNQVFMADLAIELVLIENNDQIIFLDANSDPFNNDDGDGELNVDVINDRIGFNNYDIGHVVTTGGGGLAVLGAVCGTYKADGVTGLTDPINDPFVIDYVAHELGHQFGADHTYNTGVDNCISSRAPESAFEPGSGSTIMSYVGICAPENLQNLSDDYYHAHSLEQINNYLASGTGSTCGTFVTNANNAPQVSAGSDFTIPANTPFMLQATGSDSDGDAITYVWEQYNPGIGNDDATTSPSTMIDNGSRPIFRSYKPSSNAVRYLPRLSAVVSGTLPIGEAWPTTDRNLQFRVTARDNKGGVSFDDVNVNVTSNSGPFTVTAPINNASWNNQQQQQVSWSIANTNVPPVSCSKVDILLSTDNGKTFPTLLAETDNDGQHQVDSPSINTSQARIMVRCNNGGFFNISSAFAISYSSKAPVITGQNAINITEDSSYTLTLADIIYTDGDSDDSALTLMLTSGQNYTVNNATITPDSNYHGNLVVLIRLNDGENNSESFSLNINVISENDPPIANNDSLSVNENSSATNIDVMANDSDVDEGDQLTIIDVSTSGNGAVSIVDNRLSYTPSAGFSGQEVLTYFIADQSGATASASVTVTVRKLDNGGSSGSSGGGGSISNWLIMLFALTQSMKKGFIKGRKRK